MHLAQLHRPQIVLEFLLGQVDFKEAGAVIDPMPAKAPQHHEGVLRREELVLSVVRERVGQNVVALRSCQLLQRLYAGGRRAFPKNGYVVVKANGVLELQGYYDLTGPGRIAPANPQFRVGKLVDMRRPNFRQELIYGGRVGDQIKLTYREFAGELARTAFSQDVQYDLTTDKTIGFKGVRIEVISATNTKLEYRVLKSFPDPQ